MKAFQKKLIEDIEDLKRLHQIYINSGWVVSSENHVYVGKEHGLNGTGFAVKSPISCCNAVVFRTEEEALLHTNCCLYDGNGTAISLYTDLASEFFSKEIDSTKKLLLYMYMELINK